MRYQDKHGEVIREGMFLRFENGSIEMVYETVKDGQNDLGIHIGSEDHMHRHDLGGSGHEFCPLSEVNLSEVEIYDPELAMQTFCMLD